MTSGAEGSARAAAVLRRTFAAKARAEIADADRLLARTIRVKGAGDPLARVLLVKGRPGPEDIAARKALAGADGEAAAKALEALGRDTSSVWATCSRPMTSEAEAVTRRLELIVEAVDPELVLALDRQAADDVAAALHLAHIAFGVPMGARGRVIGAVDGLEASLGDAAAKGRVWRQMRAVFAEGAEGGSRSSSVQEEGRPKAPRRSG